MNFTLRTKAEEAQRLDDLFDKYKNLVYRTAWLMLGDEQEAEDALQEVFIRVYRAINSYQPEKGALTTWLHRITLNYCLNYKRNHLPISISFDRDFIREAGNSQRAIEDHYTQNDEIQRALCKLSPKVRAVIVLRFYWNMSYSEIAHTLEVPVGTVQSRLNLGMQDLRREVEQSQKTSQKELGSHNPEEANQ